MYIVDFISVIFFFLSTIKFRKQAVSFRMGFSNESLGYLWHINQFALLEILCVCDSLMSAIP